MLANTSLKPRPLQLEDVPAAMDLSSEAGWNQIAADWRMLIEHDPQACFALDIDGELAATTTLVCYGKRLGWIGMVLTRERFRRRGCARVLLEHAIAFARARGLQALKLDASEMGLPLYAELGFREEQPVERWRGDIPRGLQSTLNLKANAMEQQRLDMQAFGADRTALLQSLAGRGRLIISDSAFALTRPGRIANYLGPCVARGETAAQKVIESAFNEEGLWFWDLLPGNGAAVKVARDLGFAPVRRLTRMRLGEPLPECDEMVFAIGGFELG